MNLLHMNVIYFWKKRNSQVKYQRLKSDLGGKKIMIPGDITQELEKNSQFGKFNKKRKFNDGKYEISGLKDTF